MDNRWAWSLDQPCAWEWRVKHGSEAAQHLKTPTPLAKALPSSTAAPAQAASLAAAQSSHLPANASAEVLDAQQQKADNHSDAVIGDALPGASAGQPNGSPSGQRAAQVPRGCLTERNASSAKGGPMLAPKPPKAAKRLKFSALAGDLAEAPSQACTSAITALTQQLAKPACHADLPLEAQPQSSKAVGPHSVPHVSATQTATASDAKSRAAVSPVSAQTRSQKQSDAQQSSDKVSQAEPSQTAGSKGECSSQSAAANGDGPPGSPDGAPDGARYEQPPGLYLPSMIRTGHTSTSWCCKWLGYPGTLEWIAACYLDR